MAARGDGKLRAFGCWRMLWIEECLVASLTATPRSGVQSGAGTVFTPHRLQCGMLNLEESLLYRCNTDLV